MGMNTGSGKDDDVMVDINTTPLIDVMLVLLIMFIITIPVQMHSVKMNMPVSNNAVPTTPPVVVKIDLDDNGRISWDGEALSGRPAMEARMVELLNLPEQPEIHLKPTKATEYVHVAGAMASAQRIGLTKIGIVGNERFIR